jgi:hypothetical protein
MKQSTALSGRQLHLTAGAVGTDRIDDTQLQLPVASRLDADDRGIPTGRGSRSTGRSSTSASHGLSAS